MLRHSARPTRPHSRRSPIMMVREGIPPDREKIPMKSAFLAIRTTAAKPARAACRQIRPITKLAARKR
jgi:hypothetical protein